jgi:hypothetical protein
MLANLSVNFYTALAGRRTIILFLGSSQSRSVDDQKRNNEYRPFDPGGGELRRPKRRCKE